MLVPPEPLSQVAVINCPSVSSMVHVARKLASGSGALDAGEVPGVARRGAGAATQVEADRRAAATRMMACMVEIVWGVVRMVLS